MSSPRSHRLLLVLGAVATAVLLGSVVPRAEAAEAPTKRYRDRNAKFSFRYFPSWTPIPIESSSQGGWNDVAEDCLVVKLSESKDRGQMPAEIRAYRMGPGGKPQGARGSGATTTGEPGMDEPGMGEMPKLPKIPGIPGLGDGPKNMVGLFDEMLERVGSKKRLGGDKPTEKPKDVQSKDKVPGKMWLVETSDDEGADPKARARNPWVQSYFHVFAVWNKDGTETGLWIFSEGNQRKKLEPMFKQVVSSFLWFDDKAEDVESLSMLDGLKISAKRRREIERTMVEGWDVVVSKKKNYIVIYNTKGRRNDQLARIIAERIEQIREQVYEVQFPPAKPVDAVSIARVCGDRAEYHKYGGPGGSAGYWSSGTEELVFYDASPKKDIDDDTLAVLYHEAFHQYIYYSVGSVAPHSWFNEGHGDYYAGAKYSGGKFVIKPFRWRTGVLQGALAQGPSPFQWEEKDGRKFRKWDREKGGYSPLSELVNMSQGEYYSYPSVSYAQGWGLVYFLREKVPQNPKWKEKWGHILDTYFNVLKTEANKEKPLVPPSVKPGGDGDGDGNGGMGDPGMDEPGMDDGGMADEPKPEPGPGEGGDEPGMGDDKPEPGMGDGKPEPGMGDGKPEPGPGEGGDPDEGPGIPMLPSDLEDFFSGGKALQKAVEEAFKGVDMKELEDAWKSTMKKVS